MKQEYYKLPLRLSALFEENGGTLERCNEQESIDQNIELLLTTCPGEHHFDENYGSHIWDLDFERVVSRSQWKERFLKYVKESIDNYEPRLSNVTVSMDLRDVVKEDRVMDSVTVRKRVDIYVDGMLNSTSQWCRFCYTLYLGPLSSE